MTQHSESIASQATLGAAEEITATEGTAETDDESRRAAWQASVRRLVLVSGPAAHARPETGQGMSEAEESDDDGDGNDEAEHEESEERQESKGSEENGVGELMPSGASAEEEPEDDSEAELDPDAIVRQYLQHEAGADADGSEGREKTGEP